MSRAEQHERARREFTRQAEPLSRSAVFAAGGLLGRIAALVAAAPAEHVLDVACGPGLVASRLAQDAGAVVGVDLTPAMLERARELCAERGQTNVRFECAAAEALPFEDASFDVVVSRLAFHHFDDPAAALDEMVRVARPGGRIAVFDITTSEDPAEAALHNALETLRDPSHARALAATELDALLASRALEPIGAEAWSASRRFEEWIAITGAEERAAPIEQVMRALAQAGIRAGLGLRIEEGAVAFDHHWVGRVARVPR